MVNNQVRNQVRRSLHIAFTFLQEADKIAALQDGVLSVDHAESIDMLVRKAAAEVTQINLDLEPLYEVRIKPPAKESKKHK